MSWIELTEADLLTALSGPELEKLRAAALKSGQSDPVQPVLDQITSEVRGRVAACDRNQLGDGNTIPSELKDAALALVVMRIMTRAAGTVIDPQGARKAAAERADKTLEAVAACRFAIVQPVTASTDEVGTTLPSVTARTHRFQRCDQSGL